MQSAGQSVQSVKGFGGGSKQMIRISILQSSKIMTAMYAIMGLIYTLIGIPMAIFDTGAARIIGIIYIMGPVFMAIVGFIFFVIFAAIYNVLATSLGGFEFELRDVEGSSATGM